MDLERLAEFVCIMRCGSLKQAAGELGLSVATLSARLRRFEEYLGTPLFTRTSAALELTPGGQQLLSSAAEILAQYRQVCQEMHRIREHTYRKLRIAISGPGVPLHLGPFLDELIRKHPQMHLELLDDTTLGIQDGLSSGAVDLYFSPISGEPVPRNLIQHTIGTPGEFVILPHAHRLADRSTISIRELNDECFVLYPKTAVPAIRDFQLKNLRDSGIRYTVYESETSVLFNKLLVPIGKGIILCTHMLNLPPNSVCIPVKDLPHHASICFFYHKGNANPDVPAFVRDYLSYAKEAASYEHRQAL